jgi:hypothetical protein
LLHRAEGQPEEAKVLAPGLSWALDSLEGSARLAAAIRGAAPGDEFLDATKDPAYLACGNDHAGFDHASLGWSFPAIQKKT